MSYEDDGWFARAMQAADDCQARAWGDLGERDAVVARLSELGWTRDCTRLLSFTRRTALVQYRHGGTVADVVIDLDSGEAMTIDCTEGS